MSKYFATVNKENYDDFTIYKSNEKRDSSLSERFNTDNYYHEEAILPEEMETIKQISFDRYENNKLYFIIDEIKNQKYISELWDFIRADRNMRLLETDIYFLKDTFDRCTNRTINKLIEYREILRDITDNFDDPRKVIFPEKPEIELKNKD